MDRIPSGLTGERNIAQNAASQYDWSTLIVAMSGGAIIVTSAEATTRVRT